MKERKSALFIINPHSGPGKHTNIPKLLDRYLDRTMFEWDVVFTRFAGEATSLCEAGKARYDVIIAVGGDGTINEVARPLVNTNIELGVIPCGSGNGLARHLKIPRNTLKAIKMLNSACTTKIDTIRLNDTTFLNVAGVGFDAHIAKLFANSKQRGFISYVFLVLSELRKFKASDYHLSIDGEEKTEKEPFLISFANSSQYGNNAHIAPGALISDGLMDICVLRHFPLWYYPMLTYRLFHGSLKKSKYYECWQGKELVVQFSDSEEIFIHLDGDPYVFNNSMKLSVDPLSLNVLCPA